MDTSFHGDEIAEKARETEARKLGIVRDVEWRLTKATELRFQELLAQHKQCEESSDAAMALEDAMRSLPGFPADTNPDTFVRRVLTDIQH